MQLPSFQQQQQPKMRTAGGGGGSADDIADEVGEQLPYIQDQDDGDYVGG
jgi:hypothetical protein